MPDLRVINIDSAEHYTWGERCDGWHMVRCPELSVIEERMPPGTSEVRHSHARSRQFFRVLQGELTLEVEGVLYLLGPGSGLEVAPGKRHRAWNSGNADVSILVISQPPSHGDRLPAPPCTDPVSST